MIGRGAEGTPKTPGGLQVEGKIATERSEEAIF